jgi:hypothetical protein
MVALSCLGVTGSKKKKGKKTKEDSANEISECLAQLRYNEAKMVPFNNLGQSAVSVR